MKKLKLVLLVAVVAPLLFASCKKAETSEYPIHSNEDVEVKLTVGIKTSADDTEYSVLSGMPAKAVFTIKQDKLHKGPNDVDEVIVVNLEDGAEDVSVMLPCPDDGAGVTWNVDLLPFESDYTDAAGEMFTYEYDDATSSPTSVAVKAGQAPQSLFLYYAAGSKKSLN